MNSTLIILFIVVQTTFLINRQPPYEGFNINEISVSGEIKGYYFDIYDAEQDLLNGCHKNRKQYFRYYGQVINQEINYNNIIDIIMKQPRLVKTQFPDDRFLRQVFKAGDKYLGFSYYRYFGVSPSGLYSSDLFEYRAQDLINIDKMLYFKFGIQGYDDGFQPCPSFMPYFFKEVNNFYLQNQSDIVVQHNHVMLVYIRSLLNLIYSKPAPDLFFNHEVIRIYFIHSSLLEASDPCYSIYLKGAKLPVIDAIRMYAGIDDNPTKLEMSNTAIKYLYLRSKNDDLINDAIKNIKNQKRNDKYDLLDYMCRFYPSQQKPEECMGN